MQTMNATNPDDLIPLKPEVFAILLVLLEGDAHGYAIMQRARERSTRRGQLQPGAMYRVLKRMLDDGLIEELDRRTVEAAGDERRRYYRVTPFGREVSAAEARRMADLVTLSRAHHLLGEAKST